MKTKPIMKPWEWVAAIVSTLLFCALVGACVLMLASVLNEAFKEIGNSCNEHCEGQGLQVASHTVYGCECKEAEVAK